MRKIKMSKCDKCKHKDDLKIYDGEGHLTESSVEIFRYGRHWVPMYSLECKKCKIFQDYVKSELMQEYGGK